MVNRQLLSSVVTNTGKNLAELSDQSPILLVFLRQFGCNFCKESLYDIGKKRSSFENKGIKLVIVHMADYETAESYFKDYNLNNIEHISDPTCRVYIAFGLIKGTLSQLVGLKTWARGFEIAVTKQITPGLIRIGDGFQMPGIFVLKNGAIIESFIHNSVADKPNYESFIDVCSIN